MRAKQKLKYFMTAMAIAIFFLHGNPHAVFAQHGGGVAVQGGEGMTGGITIQAVTGTVVETMDSGGYSYALVEKDGTRSWVALPKSRIAVGDEISCKPGMVMNNFRSSSLQRIFDHIVFSGGLISSSSTATAPAEPATPVEEVEAPKPKPREDWKGF